jgi:SAM-dependent methyltransferase
MRPTLARSPLRMAHLADWLRHSLRHKGVLGLFDFAVSFLADFGFDLRYGTDTMGWVAKTDLAPTSANRRHSSKYQATKFRPFVKLMAGVRFPPGSVFVDVGSGKGKVLLLASRYEFARIVGIEFDARLARIARHNIAIHREITGHQVPIEVVCADALDYALRGDENVWFLYNPFDEVVMRRFLRKLQRSLAERPRKIWLIYHVPRHRQALEREMFRRSDFRLVGGSEFQIYES